MAIKSQNSFLSVGTATAGSSRAITALTNANPGVATSTAHTLTNGTVGVMTGVVGMTQVNNRAFVVRNQAANTFELGGQDLTTAQGYSAYVSGGSFQPWTMVEVGEVRSISGFDGESPEIDTTHLRSQGKEYLLGLQDPGNVQLTLWLPAGSDVGQTRLRALRESATLVPFTFTDSANRVTAFMALVKSFALAGVEPDGAVQITCSLRVSNAVSWLG